MAPKGASRTEHRAHGALPNDWHHPCYIIVGRSVPIPSLAPLKPRVKEAQ